MPFDPSERVPLGRSGLEVTEYPELLGEPMPDGLWTELRAEGLLDPAAPTPAGRPS